MTDSWDYHGDRASTPQMLNFAVNVCSTTPPPVVLDILQESLRRLGHYPQAADIDNARHALADLHKVPADWVLPLAGETEAFDLLSQLPWNHVSLLSPSYTGAEAPFHHHGAAARLHHVAAAEDLPQLPSECELAIVGNPVNPTSQLYTRSQIDTLRASGRVVVVDEAFMDVVDPALSAHASYLSTASHQGSVPAQLSEDVLVLRSCTKTWGLAGLRVGYAIGHPRLLSLLCHLRSPWTVSTPALAFLGALPSAPLRAELDTIRTRLQQQRSTMSALLLKAQWAVREPAAGPFLLASPPVTTSTLDELRLGLQTEGIAVRRTDTFPLLDGEWWRLAVKDRSSVLRLVHTVSQLLEEVEAQHD